MKAPIELRLKDLVLVVLSTRYTTLNEQNGVIKNPEDFVK